jgi:hypothetical protein
MNGEFHEFTNLQRSPYADYRLNRGLIRRQCIPKVLYFLISAGGRQESGGRKMPTVVGGSALFELHLTAERLYCIGGAKADGDWTEKEHPETGEGEPCRGSRIKALRNEV